MQQAEGPITPGRGAALAELLESRVGRGTVVRLEDDQELYIVNSASGRDIGDEWEHLHLNGSPAAPGLPIHFARTCDVVEVRDAVTNEVLYVRPDLTEGRNDS